MAACMIGVPFQVEESAKGVRLKEDEEFRNIVQLHQHNIVLEIQH
jgi:hypothetical protein